MKVSHESFYPHVKQLKYLARQIAIHLKLYKLRTPPPPLSPEIIDWYEFHMHVTYCFKRSYNVKEMQEI
jgi:hypothetical protein